MQLSHSRPVASAIFDDPNLVSCAGLVPIVALAQQCGLAALADEHLSLPTDKGANAGAKVTSLVAGMVAGADSIEDMALLRHGAMSTLFDRPYAPSTLGSFLREFSFGHVRQLDAVAARLVTGLHGRTPLLAGIDGPVLVDIDDTIIEVHGLRQTRIRLRILRGSGTQRADHHRHHRAGRTGDRSASDCAKAHAGLPRGAARMVADTLATVERLRCTEPTAREGRCCCGPTPRSTGTPPWRRRSAAGPRCRSPCAWTRRSRPPSPRSPMTDGRPSSTPTPSTTRPPSDGSHAPRSPRSRSPRLAPRRPPSRSPAGWWCAASPTSTTSSDDGQGALFDTWRFHAFFTTSDLDTVTADKTHRGHAIIEQVHADLKDSALAHLPSGRFNANAAWLVAGSDGVQPHPRRRHHHRTPHWPEPAPPPSAAP